MGRRELLKKRRVIPSKFYGEFRKLE